MIMTTDICCLLYIDEVMDEDDQQDILLGPCSATE